MAEGGEQQQDFNAAILDDEVDGQNILAANNNLQGKVNTVQIKIPPFWKADPDLYKLKPNLQQPALDPIYLNTTKLLVN